LDEISEIPWNRPPLELLVLSACETAVGNGDAELGFAGLALNAGVKSALASLWSVSDAGTLVLMSEFYQQLNQSTTKAEALRQAQLKLLRKEVQIQSDRLVLSRGTIPVPDNLQVDGQTEFSHPFFWAGFTLISSPW
jgi:CHAT domain-containing protein